MHIFGLRRTKSIASKNNSKHLDSPPSSATSSKLQLVPNLPNPARPSPSPSTSPVLPNNHPTQPVSSAHTSSPTKRAIASKISHRDVLDDRSKTVQSASPSPIDTQAYQGLTPAPPRSPRASKPTYSELYTQNDLSTFSFGAAPAVASSSVSQLPVDPLTRLPEDDEISLTPSALQDTTPRPSVVGAQPPLVHNLQRPTHNNWDSQNRLNPASRGARAAGKAKAHDSDSASSHTFGTSSASASVSSLSRPRGDNSRAASRTSGYSSTTPQTSANDLTSDEDDDMIGRHPLPPEPRPPGPPFRYTSPDQESSLFLSEEEFDGEGYVEEYEPDIEIESVVPDSDRGTIDYMNDSQESFQPIQTERRGSAAMAIPKKQFDSTYHDSFQDNNSSAWEFDYSNRRGSKSMIERSFIQGAESSHGHSLPPAPASVPESEGDWQNLRKRSMTAQRDNNLAPVPAATPSFSVSSSSTQFSSNNGSTPAPDAVPATDSWFIGAGINGLVDIDSSEMQDIVDTDVGGRFFRKGSTNSAARRTSTVSSTDIIHKNITTSWETERDRERRLKWSSFKAKEGDEQANRRQNGERERPSIANLFPRTSTSTSTDVRTNGSSLFLDKPDTKHKEKEKTGSSKAKWTGMAPDSEEIWYNSHLGKHKVQRKNAPATEPGKPQQQRLQAQHLRSPNGGRDQPDGPNITIHKHSKAAAFSLSRSHRRTTSSSTTGQATGSGGSRNLTSSGGQVSSRDSTGNNRKKSNMILLATRRVQKAYTSTNTTRKLDTHGLLDDNGRTSPQPQHAESSRRAAEREHDRHRSAKTKDKESRTRDKEAKAKDKERKEKSRSGEGSSSKRLTSKSEGKLREVVAAETPLPDSSESSAGSVSYAISSGDSGTMVDSSSGTSPDQTQVTDPTGSNGSIEPSIRSQETASSDRTISRGIYKGYLKPRRRGDYDSYDDLGEDEEDDSSDGISGIPRPPTRTPHRETYAALPPEVFEAAHQEPSSTGLFSSWKKPKLDGTSRIIESSYKPPWPVSHPRTNSETRKGIVDDLNSSFQDVGLLPATGEIKGSSHSGQRRKHDQHPKKSKRNGNSQNPDQPDIFDSVPDEALYMLLPLYPSDTDPYSSRKYPFTMPTIPAHARQYLMIFYKTYDPRHPTEENGKSRSGEKKRAHESADTTTDKSVLLHTFHITARVFSYRDLQGSGVRIPEVGLAVCGPLEEAYNSIPLCQRKDQYVIGVCHSRESGIQFIPDGFEKMGLTMAGPNVPETSDEEDNSPIDPLRDMLTPIGRAVVEMAWVGALAVSSFNPNHS
ncbi:hypothetical protein JR316_0002456 [Psilocybe cubensis]|uniref:Uncharacterized protein n=2 Tax=Psilocybe cubensis TaxID=181762 RepID=A0ACB8HDK3_PSICU|nr:hypothetical protein JR316_0002456 [Psilocybe cubensis]KAH9485546.1 hypothetical protein JR316_0002456 [Psilocybe cubensis]